MYRRLICGLCLVLLPAVLATAQEPAPAPAPAPGPMPAEPKELSGMSIVGNDDAPKSLYIVPWKGSELGVETSLNRMLNEAAVPVDREVFMRQLAFYEISAAKASADPQPAPGDQK